MKIYEFIIILFGILEQANCQKAILFSSSIGYYNYRQTSNVLKVYHKLKQYGFKDEDIVLMIPENTACCQKNPLFGDVSFVDNEYSNLNHDLQIDYDYSDINLPAVFDILRLKFKQNEVYRSKFTLPASPQPLFIYLTGHGGNSYFKIRERQAIIDEHFKKLFIDLSLSKRFSKILLISDSCSAITPFQTINIQNFVAFGSSSYDQKSSSHGYDKLLNAPKSDDFTFYFLEYLQKNDPTQKKVALKQLFLYMSFDKLKVHAKIVGKGRMHIKSINQFLVKKRLTIKKKQFKLSQFL